MSCSVLRRFAELGLLAERVELGRFLPPWVGPATLGVTCRCSRSLAEERVKELIAFVEKVCKVNPPGGEDEERKRQARGIYMGTELIDRAEA